MEYLVCQFCGESGFDLVGLKGHLLDWCAVFAETETPFQETIRLLSDKEASRREQE